MKCSTWRAWNNAWAVGDAQPTIVTKSSIFIGCSLPLIFHSLFDYFVGKTNAVWFFEGFWFTVTRKQKLERQKNAKSSGTLVLVDSPVQESHCIITLVDTSTCEQLIIILCPALVFPTPFHISHLIGWQRRQDTCATSRFGSFSVAPLWL